MAVDRRAAGRPPPGAAVCALIEAAAASAAYWGDPATAARLAPRLAELGVARGERAAADLRHALLANAAEAEFAFRLGGQLPAGVTLVRLLEQAVEADPSDLSAAVKLAGAYAAQGNPRRGLAVARAALARASPVGCGMEVVALLLGSVELTLVGGDGPRWRARDVRPLLNRAQRILDGNRRWAPRSGWEFRARQIAEMRAEWLDHGMGEGAWVPCMRPPASPYREVLGRTCAVCGTRSAEMPQCSRCAGTPAQVHYCSPACQRAHWPAHKAACKAAAAAAAAAASGSR